MNRIILYIRANDLYQQQFLEILQLSKTSAEDILYHTAARWLFQGETSRRVLLLHNKITDYYSTKNKECPLQTSSFLTPLAFQVDFLSLVNNLNQSLQQKATTVCSMYKKVLAFCDKFRLLKNHLQQHNFFHFPQLTSFVNSNEIQVDNIPVTVFSGVFDAVLQDFADRFQDFEKISQTLRLVALPHLVDTERAPLHLQMELVELKNNEKLVGKFNQEENLIESAAEYPLLRELARETQMYFLEALTFANQHFQ